jgi:hypothetical protein
MARYIGENAHFPAKAPPIFLSGLYLRSGAAITRAYRYHAGQGGHSGVEESGRADVRASAQ